MICDVKNVNIFTIFLWPKLNSKFMTHKQAKIEQNNEQNKKKQEQERKTLIFKS